MISTTQLQAICPHAGGRVASFIQPINEAMSRFAILTPRRQAAFLAQCAHESGEFRYTRELASGDDYEGRVDLGNTQPGDGRKFRGIGVLQVTGRANITAAGIAIGVDLASDPTQGETPNNACLISAWFWSTHLLSELADENKFGTITKKINGGYTGIDQRLAYWLVALRACGAL